MDKGLAVALIMTMGPFFAWMVWTIGLHGALIVAGGTALTVAWVLFAVWVGARVSDQTDAPRSE